jgi:hypothetical protein
MKTLQKAAAPVVTGARQVADSIRAHTTNERTVS